MTHHALCDVPVDGANRRVPCLVGLYLTPSGVLPRLQEDLPVWHGSDGDFRGCRGRRGSDAGAQGVSDHSGRWAWGATEPPDSGTQQTRGPFWRPIPHHRFRPEQFYQLRDLFDLCTRAIQITVAHRPSDRRLALRWAPAASVYHRRAAAEPEIGRASCSAAARYGTGAQPMQYIRI